MYTMMEDVTSVAPRESMAVMVELFHKGVWRDEKTVSVISQGVFHPDAKVITLTLRFFLSPQKSTTDSDDEKDERIPSRREIEHEYGARHSRKTRAAARKLEKKQREASHKRKVQMEREVHDEKQYNAVAMSLLRDPQGYSEKVLSALKRSNHAFELKIQLMALLSRLIHAHTLLLPAFYSHMLKYTQPHQKCTTPLPPPWSPSPRQTLPSCWPSWLRPCTPWSPLRRLSP